MLYALFAVAQISKVLYNAFSNFAGKKLLTKKADSYYFSFIINAVCMVFFLLAAVGSRVSLFSVGLGILFGVFTALCHAYSLLAFSAGPMNFTHLMITSSIILSSLSGVILYDESFSPAKLFFTLCLIGFITLAVGGKDNGTAKSKKRWILYCFIAFFSQGSIGVMQKIHQNSEHKNEIFGFLAAAFITASFCSILLSGRKVQKSSFGKTHYVTAFVCGVCTVLMNYLNLQLSGKLPSQFFFPFSAGCGAVLVSLVSLLVFKEKLYARQAVGLIGGILTLIAICIF